jgi:hypothetical protein
MITESIYLKQIKPHHKFPEAYLNSFSNNPRKISLISNHEKKNFALDQ